MKYLLRYALSLSLLLLGALAPAQVATGSYPYGTFDNQGFDSINVGNLNVHFALPVLHKTGRGMPFTYALAYDSSVWYPLSVNGSLQWTPLQAFGWKGTTEVATGYLSYSSSTTSSGSGGRNTKNIITNYYGFEYHDPFGVTHPFIGSTSKGTTGSCPSGVLLPTYDGSGYTLSVSGCNQGTLLAANGKQILLAGSNNGAAVATDSNGNQITVDGQGHFTDTTGNVALTVAGTAPSPVTFTYSGVNGNTQTVTMNYATYNVQTNFGCSGIAEYGPTATSLVSSITFPDGGAYQFSYEPTPGAPGNVTGRLASVQLPQGGVIKYAYSGSSNGIECTDGSTAGLTRTLNGDSGSAPSTWSYSRTIPGSNMSQTAVVDGLGNHKIYNFIQPGEALAAQYYETSRSVYNGAATGTPVFAQQTCYNGAAPPCNTTIFVVPISQIDTYKTRDGLQTNGATSMFNANGMQTEAEVWDFAPGTSARGPLLRKEIWTYGYSIPSLVTSDVVYDGSGNPSAKTLYAYDGAALTASSGVPQHIAVSAPRGNLTSMTQYASSGKWYTTSFTYEDTGSVLTATTPNGTTTYSYDPTFTYPTAVSLPTPSSGVAFALSATYDATNTGLPLSSTDANSQSTEIPSYDPLLRPAEIAYPDGGQSTFSYSPTTLAVTILVNSASTAYGELQYDGYGRVSRAVTANGQSGNGYYQQDTCYNANSRAAFKSYRYQGSGLGAAKLCSGAGANYAYDALGRVVQVMQSNGEMRSYQYLGRAKKSVDPNGVTRISQVDGLGRTTIVCEISSNAQAGVSPTACGTDIAGTGFQTTYIYALASHTTTITQGAQTRVFQSDWLGRPTSIQEPESGQTTYSYAYNSTGLLITRQRPQANQSNPVVLTTTTTQYDSLSRVVSISYSDSTPTKSFAYDAGAGANFSDLVQTNLKGRLSLASAPNAMTAYSYDALGRIRVLDECLPSGCGTVTYNHQLLSTYDLAGEMTSSTDGGAALSTYTYSPAGEILSLSSSISDSTDPSQILSGAQYGPFGPLSYTLGNGLTGEYSYDVLGRLSGGEIFLNGAQVYGFVNGWKGRQLTGAADSVLNQGSTYGYDEFNRLTSRTVNSGTGPNYGWIYDRYGNRLQQNMTGGTGSGPIFTASVNPANNQLTGYTYDAAGNMIYDGFHSYTYDAEGRITAVDAGTTAQYVYNALGQRVQATVGSTITGFVFNAAGQRVSEWNGTTQLEGKYYWGGKPVAYYAGGATHFEHQDWLGTERMRTSYNGSVEGAYISLPFGDGQAVSGADTDSNHYAQLDHDMESDTDRAQFRQYANLQGRWLAPDSYSSSYKSRNPQSFNRYVYVMNNPLAMVDPLGLNSKFCPAGIGWCNKYGAGGGMDDGTFYGMDEFDVMLIPVDQFDYGFISFDPQSGSFTFPGGDATFTTGQMQWAYFQVGTGMDLLMNWQPTAGFSAGAGGPADPPDVGRDTISGYPTLAQQRAVCSAADKVIGAGQVLGIVLMLTGPEDPLAYLGAGIAIGATISDKFGFLTAYDSNNDVQFYWQNCDVQTLMDTP